MAFHHQRCLSITSPQANHLLLSCFSLLLALCLMACVARPWCAAESHLPQPIKGLLGHCLSLQSLWRTHSPRSRIFTPLLLSVEPVKENPLGCFLYSSKLAVCSSLYYFFLLFFFFLEEGGAAKEMV